MKVSREDVLAEATRQLNRRGAAASLLKDVAAALGVTRMAIYWYAQDREDLVRQCYARTCETLESCLDKAQATDGSPWDALEAFLDAALRGPELCAIVEPGLLPAEGRQEILERFDAIVADLAAVLLAGAEAGVLRPCDEDTAARSIISLVFWASIADVWNEAPSDGERDALIACAKDLVAWGRAVDRRAPMFTPIDLKRLGGPAVVDAFDRDVIAAARREQILAAASQRFNRQGIDSTRLDEIAADLNATTGAIYHHLGRKPVVVAECLLRTLRLAIGLQAAANAIDGPRAAAMAAFQHGWAMAQMRPELAPLFPLTGFEALPGPGQAAFHEETARLADLTQEHMRAGIAEGGLRPLPAYAMRLQGGLLGWLARAGVEDETRREEIAQEAAAQLLLGVRALPD